MVGLFGYKAEYSELSRAIGARLFARIAGHDGDVVISGTSCRSQIEERTGRTMAHPVEVPAVSLPSVQRTATRLSRRFLGVAIDANGTSV